MEKMVTVETNVGLPWDAEGDWRAVPVAADSPVVRILNGESDEWSSQYVNRIRRVYRLR